MDIGSKNKWPSSALSNFAIHHFTFRKIECYSMEGLLQSLKFDKPHKQTEICKLIGREAKIKSQKRNKIWQKNQILYWMGRPIKRDSKEYQLLLDESFASLSENENFEKALLATGNEIITHKMGNNDITKTILTEKEFCSKLMYLRKIIRKEKTKND
ncbi:MAG: hypothetical protein WD512_16015 [Candidatus Paceibacterota bacterium]